MIKIFLNTDEFEYDIRSLVKAFYPMEYQFLQVDESKTEKQKESKSEEVRYSIRIHIDKCRILVNWFEGDCYLSNEQGEKYEAVTVESPRKERKNDVKRLLFTILSEKTGRILPWGTLTGIRPTKLMMQGIAEGESKQRMKERMQREYFISDEKFELGYEVACRECDILARLSEEKGYSIYVSIPFCPTTCLYCSFTSYPELKWQKHMDRYVEAVKKELAFLAKAMKERELNTVYFGGGTPTTLSAEQLEDIISYIFHNFDTSHVVEFTVEAGRPDSITREKLEVLKRCGVSRISINPQTMKQQTLDLIGRRHTVSQTVEAFAMARECGFDNINMDLILGLPGEHKEDVEKTLIEVCKLGPDNLTVHALARKRTSRLTQECTKYKELYFDDATESMDIAGEYAKRMGLVPYYLYRQKNMAGNQENVGYAKPDKEGIYNILIMEERQSILAVGAGGITKLVKTPGELCQRVETVKDVAVYLERIDEMIERKKEALQSSGLMA